MSLAAVGLVLAGLAASEDRAVDAGMLPEVYAEAPARVDSLQVESTLVDVLNRAGYPDHRGLVSAFRRHWNPARISAAADVRVHRRGDARAEPHLVEVEVDRGDVTVVLWRVGDAWEASMDSVATRTDTLFVSGEIQESLWASVIRNAGLEHVPDPGQVVNSMDAVFQWQVDFSRQIQPGDTYRLVFERETRPEGTMRSGRLLAAELRTGARSLTAIWYDANGDGRGTWYDRDGESVRRAFLKKPLKLSRISSRFSLRRFHPILKTWRAHRGVDYAASAGAPVEATGDGVVTRRGWSDSYGRVIDVEHPNGFLTRYAHLSGFARGTSVGQRVAQGQEIGYVGMTGLATAPHLHYEMHRGGRPIDPLVVDLPADDPVPLDDWDRWERQRDERLEMLFTLPATPAGIADRPVVASEASSG